MILLRCSSHARRKWQGKEGVNKTPWANGYRGRLVPIRHWGGDIGDGLPSCISGELAHLDVYLPFIWHSACCYKRSNGTILLIYYPVSKRTGASDITIAREPGLSDWQLEAIFLGMQPLGK